MKAGIQITGRDFGCVGLDDDANLDAHFARLAVVERFGLLGGGSLLGNGSDLDVDFVAELESGEDVTVATWKELCVAYREAFPTFDGHIRITDVDHVDADDAKLIDAFLNAADPSDL
jgi:hypothetical protein